MACPNCEQTAQDCGCTQESMHISQICNPIDCSSNECTESFKAECIIYTGTTDLTCEGVILATNGDNVAQIIANVIAYFCGADTIDVAITCGADTVIGAGATINDALDAIVTYFCGLITTIQGDIVTIQGDITTIQADIVTLQGDMTTAQGDITTLQGQMSTAQGDITTLQNDVAQLQADGSIFAETADSAAVVNTVTPGTLIGAGQGSLTFGAGIFAVGDSYAIKAEGQINVGAVSNLTIEILLGGSVIATTGAFAVITATAKTWSLDAMFTIRSLGAGTGSVQTGGNFSYLEDAGNKPEVLNLNTLFATLDTTGANTLEVRATWSVADASLSINSETFVISKEF